MGVDLAVILAALARGIAQLQARLGQQGIQRNVEGMADVEIFTFFTQVRRPQAHRKQRTTQGFENLGNGFTGRQFAAAMLAAQAADCVFATGHGRCAVG